MFSLFMIFCIALVVGLLCERVGIVRLRTAPVMAAVTGILLGLFYSGEVVYGAGAGLLAALGCGVWLQTLHY